MKTVLICIACLCVLSGVRVQASNSIMFSLVTDAGPAEGAVVSIYPAETGVLPKEQAAHAENPVGSIVLNERGEGRVINLPDGVYLISGDDFEMGGKIYRINPVYLSVPSESEVSLKYSTYGQETCDVSVKKVWEGSDEIPDSIHVTLFQDGKEFETVSLSSENRWKYVWEDMEGLHWYEIKEDIPEGWECEVAQDGDSFVVTNTYAGGNLPQTGQNWKWAVLFAGIGFLFILSGLSGRKKQ